MKPIHFHLSLLFVFLSLSTAYSQIREREEAPQPSRSSSPAAQGRANVNVIWQGSGTVIIHIDDRELTLRSKGSGRASLRTGKGLELYVQKPGEKYYADEFLLIDPSGGDLEVRLSGDNAAFTYESGNAKEQRLSRERERAQAERKKLEEYKNNLPSIMEASMVLVEGGTFSMGCTSEQGGDCHYWEKPVHQVTLSNFYISKYEVTQLQWRAVMGTNPSKFKGCDACPVEQVSWNDIQTFLSKLNSLTGKDYRLPTEAEWEYAARGGNKSSGYKYSGSNSVGTVGWYGDNSGEKTHPVGQKAPNELGIYDMSGNVWEWCQDWYGDYSSSSQANPRGPSSGSGRVVRGGSWPDAARGTRVWIRGNDSPDDRVNDIGFRLAL